MKKILNKSPKQVCVVYESDPSWGPDNNEILQVTNSLDLGKEFCERMFGVLDQDWEEMELVKSSQPEVFKPLQRLFHAKTELHKDVYIEVWNVTSVINKNLKGSGLYGIY